MTTQKVSEFCWSYH